MVKEEGIPGYLKKVGEKEWWSRWRRMAKFRLGNGIRGGKYWEEEEEEKRRCRLCGAEEET